MTILEINQLIDKYLEGKTSPEEEQRLALEVNLADAPQEWLIIREMLGELTLGEAIYNKEMKSRKRRRRLYYSGWGIAASLLLCLAMGGLFPKEVQEEQPLEGVKTTMVAETTVEEPQLPSPTPMVPEAQPEPKKPTMERVKVKAQPVAKITKMEEPETIEPATPVEVTLQTAIETLRAQVDEAALAQVEEKFEQWQLYQSIQQESIELEIATRELNRKYEAYLAEEIIEI